MNSEMNSILEAVILLNTAIWFHDQGSIKILMYVSSMGYSSDRNAKGNKRNKKESQF